MPSRLFLKTQTNADFNENRKVFNTDSTAVVKERLKTNTTFIEG